MKFGNQSEFSEIFKIYSEDSLHEKRQKAHFVLLYNYGFSFHQIATALQTPYDNIILYAKVWNYFKVEGLFNWDLETQKKQVQQIETTTIPSTGESNILLNILFFLKEVFTKVFTSLFQLIKKIHEYIWLFFSFLKKIIIHSTCFAFKNLTQFYVNTKNTSNAKINSLISIGNNSSGNLIFVIQQVIGESKNITTDSFEATKQFLFERFQDKNLMLSDNLIFAISEYIAQKIDKIKDEQRRNKWLHILAGATAMFLWYNIKIKAGIFTFTLLSITFAIVSTTNNSINEAPSVPPSKKIDNTQVIKDSTISTMDSIHKNAINSDSIQKKLINSDSTKMIEFDENLFEYDSECFNLTEIKENQKKYIKRDKTNYESQKFYIPSQDNRFYLYVKAYDNIQTAAFQRKFLIKNGYENCKIVKLLNDSETMYGVSIQDFSEKQITELGEKKCEWDNECYSEKVKAQAYYNGF